VAGAFGLALTGMANFLVPLRARELGASYDVIGLIVAAGAIVPAVFSVPLGTIVARLGSRRAFTIGAMSSAAVAMLFVAVTNYWWLLVLQLVIGTTRMLSWIGSQSYVTNIGPASSRAARTGKWSFFSNLGPMVTLLLIGGAAEVFGFRLAFSVIAVYSLAFGILGLVMLELGDQREAAPGRRRSTGFREVLPLLRLPGVQTALSLTCVRLLVERLWQAFVPVLLVSAGMTPALASTVVFAKSLTSTVTAPTVGWLTRWGSPATVVSAGLGCGLIGLALSPLWTGVPSAYAPAILVGIGTGLSLPLLLTIVADATTEEQRPVALGMRLSVNQAASTAAPAIGGPLIAVAGAAVAFGSIAAVGLAFLILAGFSARRMAAAEVPPEGP
jgi:MFS family permease